MIRRTSESGPSPYGRSGHHHHEPVDAGRPRHRRHDRVEARRVGLARPEYSGSTPDRAAGQGMRQRDLVRITGYSRERIRQICRAAGVEPPGDD
jgi:hypothetical protein